MMTPFVGRERELQRLEELSCSGRACLVVIKGRRRIGKSRLVQEFSKGKEFLSFSGMAPIEKVSAQDQRDEFSSQVAKRLEITPGSFTNWSAAFDYLSRHLTSKPTVIFFDEISWMGSKDPTFIPKMKNWWDLVLQKYPSVILILCGSSSPWMDKNIIKSTALFGRVSLYLDLTELTLPQCRELLTLRGFKGSDVEFYQILMLTGGVPWYIEQFQPEQSVEENIRCLCFDKNGVFLREFERIFEDLFNFKKTIYKKILRALSQGLKDQASLKKALGFSENTSLKQYLQALEICGFITKHSNWSLKKRSRGKRSLYRVADNSFRFYIHYIEPNLEKIKEGGFCNLSLLGLKDWGHMMGFQLKNLLLKNKTLIYQALGIYVLDIVRDGPYIQKVSGRKKECQIDYLIQTTANTLYICEIRMTRHRELGPEVIEEMKAKIASFSIPKGLGIAPVLLHLGPVSDALLSSEYFYRVVDIGDFLECR